MLVLVWGLPGDAPIAAVREQLRLLDVPTVFADQRLVLETEVEMVVGDEIDASLRIRGQRVDLGEVTAVYQRPYLSTQVAAVARAGPESDAWRHAIRVDDLLASWCEITPSFVINRCQAMAANDSKPYQLRQIQRFGWSTPETLITTDPAAARAFWDLHGDVIYKSISGVRSRISRLQPEHLERFSNLSSCPTQFQKYVPGTDVRVHVVASEIFASEVECSADDYRYPTGDSPVVRAISLPSELEDRCRKMAREMQLSFAGIDLRRTPQGEWFCFEVNPSPGFTYYENSTGQPISQAVARLLMNPEPTAELPIYPFPEAESAGISR
jgi:hypothetical protein